jgi:hypothetical protein
LKVSEKNKEFKERKRTRGEHCKEKGKLILDFLGKVPYTI